MQPGTLPRPFHSVERHALPRILIVRLKVALGGDILAQSNFNCLNYSFLLMRRPAYCKWVRTLT
jgi:hypothetical protein